MANDLTPGRYLVGLKFETDGLNGHFTWHCRIEEIDENGNVFYGPVVLHGMSTDILRREHGGKHEDFLLNHVKPQMLKGYDEWKHDHSEGKKLEGKRL